MFETNKYFSEPGIIPKQIGFILEGVMRDFYSNEEGNGLTRCFIQENSLVVDYTNFDSNSVATEYLQACTDCKLLVFQKKTGKILKMLLLVTLNSWKIIPSSLISYPQLTVQTNTISPVVSLAPK